MPADVVPWLLGALVALAAAGVVLLARLTKRVESLERARGGAEELARIAGSVQKLVDAHAELDLRRIEHALYDVRDAHKRLEDRLLASLEARASVEGALSAAAGSERSAGALAPASHAVAGLLAERIVTRLLALGYERIQFVTPLAEVARLSASDGEVAVEARRDGAACKGRVIVRGGAIADLALQSAYSTFP